MLPQPLVTDRESFHRAVGITAWCVWGGCISESFPRKREFHHLKLFPRINVDSAFAGMTHFLAAFMKSFLRHMAGKVRRAWAAVVDFLLPPLCLKCEQPVAQDQACARIAGRGCTLFLRLCALAVARRSICRSKRGFCAGPVWPRLLLTPKRAVP